MPEGLIDAVAGQVVAEPVRTGLEPKLDNLDAVEVRLRVGELDRQYRAVVELEPAVGER